MLRRTKSSFGIFALIGYLAVVSFYPTTLFAEELPAGVPPGALWFSKEPFFAGETISIFTVVYNSTNFTLSGTAALKDGTTTISKKEFIVPGGGAVNTIVFPWQVTPGNHSFSVLITQNELRASGGEVQSGATIVATKTAPIKRFADRDTDADGIGNAIDTDDDGDGLSDQAEAKLHTDRLNPDTDGDGMNDATDKRPLAFDKTEISVATTTKIIVGSREALEEKIKTAIPTPILSKAVPVLGHIEDFRIGEAKRGAASVDTAREAVMANETASSTSNSNKQTAGGWTLLAKGVEEGEIFTTPFTYVKLFTAQLYYSLTSSPYIFYPFILLVIFLSLRSILRLFFS